MTATDDLLAIDKLVESLHPGEYAVKAGELIRGSLPTSTFRDGGRASSSPTPSLDKTDIAVQAELQRHRKCYTDALRLLLEAAHIEKVMLVEKAGLRAEAGWPCVNWGKVWYGEVCKTDVHDHPKAVCQSCRDRKCSTEKQARTTRGELVP